MSYYILEYSKVIEGEDIIVTSGKSTPNIEKAVKGVLGTIERDREKEIISRRFGLFDRRETLEQIGELLGITRERVRQLEKAIVAKLKAQAGQGLPSGFEALQAMLVNELQRLGKVARVSDLSARLTKDNSRVDQARVAFLAQLSPRLVIIEGNDYFYHSVGLRESHDEKQIRELVNKVIKAVQDIGEPVPIEKVAAVAGLADVKHVKALASTSKHLASLNNRWGLVKWPMVNPKNIRDKIYVVLHSANQPLHFSDIAAAIKKSDFQRKDVTTQAVHNELIKDKRFVLIGRGIYALKEWGYKKGTVADVITDILKKAGQPLHRDEIIKQVLKSRQVKETTIMLNLQGKSRFKRVAKATYVLTE